MLLGYATQHQLINRMIKGWKKSNQKCVLKTRVWRGQWPGDRLEFVSLPSWQGIRANMAQVGELDLVTCQFMLTAAGNSDPLMAFTVPDLELLKACSRA